MADEFVKKLGIDISDSLAKLKELEKAIADTMKKIDEATGDDSEAKKKRDRIAAEQYVANLKKKMLLESLNDTKSYYNEQKKLDDEYRKYLRNMEKAQNEESLRDTKQELKDREAEYRAYLKREENLAKEHRKREEQAEKNYWKTVENSADNMLDVYTDVMNRVVNVIERAFSDAMKYVEEYDKALTSIALVTMKPESKGMIGETYENLAKEMSVTATELAAAGEELYRQGLGDDEVLNRMEAITIYSKISGEAFSDSVEMITAAVNSFSKEGEDTAALTMHIVDVWAKLGDAVATSASEIGVAMQKVAASGQAAGFTMEELSASIAVIESQTRAAAESVGTALNSMMSRYMKVSSAGWNTFVTTDEGDVVKINDIAKALESVGISIVNAKGEFLNFSEILSTLNGVWDGLNDANKNYIATQMAGTRSLNYFLSLMNNYDEVLELTAEGYNSAGVALEKYGIWTEGVEASQNRLSAAMQDFYSNVLSSDTVIKFTDGLTKLVEWFDKTTETSGKANIGLGLFMTAIMMGVSALGKFKSLTGSFGESLKSIARGFITSSAAINATSVAAKGATVAVGGLKAAMMSIGIGLVVTAVASLVTWLISLKDETESTADKLKRLSDEMSATADALNATQNNMADVKDLISRLDELGQKTTYTAEEIEEFNTIRNELIAKAPELASLYGIEGDVVHNLGSEYERTAQMANALHEELAVSAWKTAADGMDSALESLEQITYARVANDDIDRAKFFDIGINLGETDKRHDFLNISKSAYEAYMDGGYTNVHELQDLVDEHQEVLDRYDNLLKEKWKSISGQDKEFDVSGGYTKAMNAVAAEIAALEEEMKITGDQNLDTQITKLKEFSDELKGYYSVRGELTQRQMIYTEALKTSQEELKQKEREAWDVIVRGSSRANEVIAGYGYDIYNQMLNAMLDVDFAEKRVKNEDIVRLVTGLFADISDEVATSVNSGNTNIEKLINEEMAQNGITRHIIDALIAEDENITQALQEWSGGLIDDVQTAADPYIASWNQTISNLHFALAQAVTNPAAFHKALNQTDFTQQVYEMITQALMQGNINPATILNDVMSMTNEEAVEYLMKIVVVPEIETEESIKVLSEHLESLIKSYEQYSNMLDIGEKIKLGVELNPEDLVAVAKAAELIGLENVDLTNLDSIGSAIERIVAAMLQINGGEWENYNIGGGEDSYDAAVNVRDKMQTLYDSISGIATEGTAYDFSDLFSAYPQLIQYAGDVNTLRDEAIILLNEEKKVNGELLNQYGLAIDETEDLAKVINVYAKGANKAEIASEKLQSGLTLTADECKELIDEYPELTAAIIDYANGVITAEELTNKLNKAAENADMNKLAEGLTAALEDYDAAAANSYEATAALERMGYLLSGGMGDMSSLDFAIQNLDLIRQAINGDIEAFRQLNENAVVNIIGSADVDFRAVEDGLIAVGNISDATLQQLAKLGNFEITYVQAKSRIMTQGPNGEPQSVLVVNKYPKIKFKDLSGFSSGIKGSSGGGGGGSSGKSGGGGGGSSASTSSAAMSDEVKKKLEDMEEELTGKDYRLDIAKAWEDYFNTTDELSKSIPYMEEQIDIYKEMMDLYRQNGVELKTMATEKKAEMESVEGQIAKYTQMRDQYKKNSSKYKKYNKEVQGLQTELESLTMDYDAIIEKMQEYELAEIDSQKAIEETTKAIKEQQAAIRQTVIDMKNQIRDYYEKIDDAERDRLDATVSMQDQILDILRERAEEEMELNKEVLEDKKQRLEDEMDLLRKNFDKARELAEGNDTADTLAEKQAELARIMADPTRASERAALEKEIAELQTTIAWDTAEEQIKAQEEAKQAQIDAIDEEIDKMEKAYDDISDYSEDMINEMYSIMQKSTTEVVAWLTENSGEYANSTKEAQQQLIDDWTETMNKLKGVLNIGWGKVEDVMKEGLQSAIDLLKQTEDYKNASPEEQESMVEDLTTRWNDMIEASKQPEPKTEVKTETPPVTAPEEKEEEPEYSTVKASTRARYHLRKGYSTNYDSIMVMPTGATVEINGYHGDWYRGVYKGKTGWVHKKAFTKSIDLSKLKKYQDGGLVNQTGLAWLDGKPGKPEMVLNARETEFFRRFVTLLDRWQMPELGKSISGGNLTIEGDIVVQVGGISTNDDYNDVGQKVMDAIYDKFKIRR